jgi:hypothetical protein
MFNARIAYVVAWHRRAKTWRTLKQVRMDLEASHPQDKPEVVLVDSVEWRDYVQTEKRVLVEARSAGPRPPEARVADIETARAQVDRLIAEMLVSASE